MANVPRISVEEAQYKIRAGSDLMLVCAYDSEEKFQQNHLTGAISLDMFQQQEGHLSKDREIVFYCR